MEPRLASTGADRHVRWWVMVTLTLVATTAVSTPARAEEPVPPPEERIVGGAPAPSGAWPSQAALLGADQDDNFAAQFCGGTVVATSWVLTAAHCLHDQGERVPVSSIDVLTGTQDLDAGGRRTAASTFIVHPENVNALFRNDLALIQLDRPTGAPPQTLPVDNGDPPPGTPLTATGWGTTDPVKQRYPAQLHEVEVSLASPETCAADYQSYDYRTGQMICAKGGESGRDTCIGDSGGPLVTEAGVQVGITSWGINCADRNYPGVYTRVSTYADWIRRQIRYGPFIDAEGFVERQYLDLTGRPPSTDETNLAKLVLADRSPGAWLHDQLSSATVDGTTNALVRLYRATFRRDPDPGGLGYWAAERRGERSLTSIAEFFARSGEFVATYGSLDSRDFVEEIYGNVLGRSSDPPGVDFWTAELTSGRRSRGGVLRGFSESAEYRSITRTRTEVITTYWAMLGRIPDGGEISYWTPRGTAVLAEAILSSYEYALRF